MKDANEIINEIKKRFNQAKEDLKQSKTAGYNSPGFNQDLGHHDALGELLEWINEDQNE